jgi:CshA-type fibril repeat protein
VPSGGSVALLAGGTPVATLAVNDVGTYSLDPTTGALAFAPVAGYAGTPAAVLYRVTDAYAQTGSSTYTPDGHQACATGAPRPDEHRVLTAVQTAPAVLPVGSSLLVDGVPGRRPPSPVRALRLTTSTGALTFTPVAGFTGAATPVTYQVTDGYSQTGTSTYTPTVLPAAPTAPGRQLHRRRRQQPGGDPGGPARRCHHPARRCDGHDAHGPRQGSYLLDPSSGVLVFTPAPGFTGRPTPPGTRSATSTDGPPAASTALTSSQSPWSPPSPTRCACHPHQVTRPAPTPPRTPVAEPGRRATPDPDDATQRHPPRSGTRSGEDSGRPARGGTGHAAHRAGPGPVRPAEGRRGERPAADPADHPVGAGPGRTGEQHPRHGQPARRPGHHAARSVPVRLRQRRS